MGVTKIARNIKSMNSMEELLNEIHANKSPGRAKLSQRYFKTGKGEYGEGDKFLGLILPVMRSLSKKYYRLITISDLEQMIKNPWHEIRVMALMIADMQFAKGDDGMKEKMFSFYISNAEYINNWDLVDISAPNIVGKYLINNQDRKILYEFAGSKNLWKKRISIISTLSFIRTGQFDDTVKLAEILLHDKHDLIHKAVGWMLREMGKRDIDKLRSFLDKYGHEMPRTMLRYSIEKMIPSERKKYLEKKPQKLPLLDL